MTTNFSPIQIKRVDDLEWIGRFMESATFYCILNVFAVYGYGKSHFFHSIAKQYKGQMPVAIFSILAFEPQSQNTPFDMVSLLREFWNQWAEYLDLTSGISSELTPQQLIQELALLVDRFQEKSFRPLLIVDDFHKLPNGSRAIFEDLLAELFKTPRQVRVILGSEQRINFFNRLDLQGRLTNHSLSPLQANDLVFSDARYQNIAPEILRWTGGMPKLIEYVSQSVITSGESQEIFDEYHQVWASEEYHQKIQWAGFRDVRKATSIALDAISLARRFDVTMLSDVLPILDEAHYGSYKQKDYLDMIFELGGRKRWRDQGGGYALDPVLKGVLVEFIQTNKADEHKLIHQTIADAYHRRLEKNEYRLHYITESLYHFLEVKKLELADEGKLADILAARLMDYVTAYNNLPQVQPTLAIDHLDELRNTIDDDIDLRPFIRVEVLDRISILLKNKM